jgi:hypothetical protein
VEPSVRLHIGWLLNIRLLALWLTQVILENSTFAFLSTTVLEILFSNVTFQNTTFTSESQPDDYDQLKGYNTGM